MSDLTFIETTKLEKLFGMGSGYVLDFSNRTFADFIVESVERNIYDSKYDYESGSKANRLRAFWKREPNHVVGKLLRDLLDYTAVADYVLPDDTSLLDNCRRIAARLMQGSAVDEIDAITPNTDDPDFEVLAKSVRKSIERNEPEAGLDRLHTFVVKYVREICRKCGIATNRDKPLHSIFGEYVKHLSGGGFLDSPMTERILKTSISNLEAFNKVRNDRSLAHDNPILNYEESLLIFNHVASAIRFIRGIEDRRDNLEQGQEEATEIDDDLPF